jgi:hypothetical protein
MSRGVLHDEDEEEQDELAARVPDTPAKYAGEDESEGCNIVDYGMA